MPSDSEISDQLIPLSPDEIGELDSFLVSDATSDETMMLDALDGYLTAIALGPTKFDAAQWFPLIWGPGKDDFPAFKSNEEAQHIIGLVIRLMNGIIWDLEDNPDNYKPIFNITEYKGREFFDAETWSYGFLCGVNLGRNSWQPLFDDPKGIEMSRPIHLLGADEVTPEEIALTNTVEQREKLSKQIPACVAWIYRFWQPYHQAIIERMIATKLQQEMPDIDINQPCLCGSATI